MTGRILYQPFEIQGNKQGYGLTGEVIDFIMMLLAITFLSFSHTLI